MITYKKHHRLIATFFLLIFFPTLIPNNLFASNNGPKSAEAASFEPVDATDMVNLITGQYSYVLPLLNVPSPEGGYPIAMAYHAGIALDQDSSWTGLGWNVNPGAIERNINGYPDDYNTAVISEYFYDSSKTDKISSVSVGYSNGAFSVGLGFNWSNSQAVGGFVSVGAGYTDQASGAGGGANASIGFGSSSGNASVGVGITTAGGLTVGANLNSNGNLGGSIGYSNNTNGEGFSLGYNSSGTFSYGATLLSGNNNTSSLEVSLSSGGIGINGGVKNRNNQNKTVGGAGTGIRLSFNHTINMGDYSTKSNGWIVPIIVPTQIGTFSLSFGKQEFTYYLSTNKESVVNGVLNFNKVQESYVVSTRDAKLPNTTGNNLVKSFENLNSAIVYRDQMLIKYPNLSTTIYSGSNSNSEPQIVPWTDQQLNIPGYIFEKSTGDIHEFSIENTLNIENNNLVLPSNDNFSANSQGLSGNFRSILYENGALKGLSNYENKNGFKLIYSAPDQGYFRNKPDFYFDNEISTYLNTTDVKTISQNSDLNKKFPYEHYSSGEDYGKLKRVTSKKIEYWLNSDLVKNLSQLKDRGFLDTNATGIDRSKLPVDGIGAFSITAIDGKTYHYSLPVYNHEIITRTFGMINGKTEENQAYMEKRQLEPFATHWLLTAITGPDFIDNGDGIAGDGDLGYWTSFDYGLWSDAYLWSAPDNKEYFTDDSNSNIKTWIKGRKQIYYLDKIKTRTHTAIFLKDERNDAKSKEWEYKSVIHENKREQRESDFVTRFIVPSQKLLKLSKVLLFKNEDININKNHGVDSNTNIDINYSKNYNYTQSNTLRNSELYNSFYYNKKELAPINKYDNIIDIGDNWEQYISKAIKIVDLNYDNSLLKGEGCLTLKSVKFRGKGGSDILPPYQFEYNNENVQLADLDNVSDGWGYYKNNPSNWSLKKIITPQGGAIKINYESTKFKSLTKAALEFSNKSLTKFKSTVPTNQLLIDGVNEKVIIDIGSIHNYPISLNQSVKINFTSFFRRQIGNNIVITKYQYAGNGHISLLENTLGAGKYEVTFDNPVTSEIIYNSQLNSSIYNNDDITISIDLDGNPTFEGGGTRVSKLAVSDGLNEYSTDYKYGLNEDGIGYVSFVPYAQNITKELPYSSELPAPRVMHDYVSVEFKSTNNKSNGKIRYKFNVMKEKTPNKIKYGDFFEIEKNETYFTNNSGKNVNISSITLKDNLAAIGQLLEVSTYNSEGHLLSKISNNYFSKNEIPNSIGISKESYQSYKTVDYLSPNINDKWLINTSTRIKYPNIIKSSTEQSNGYTYSSHFLDYDEISGISKEQVMKSSDGQSYKTKIIPAFRIYPEMQTSRNMLSQVAVNYDYIFSKAENKWKETGVGITTWSNNWSYKSIDGTLTPVTFPDGSSPTYWSEVARYAKKIIWRKHKSYIWNGSKDSNGLFLNYNSENHDNFNWNIGVLNIWTGSIGVGSQPTQWKQTSEVTLYDHFSKPLEIKDVNGNYASRKMGDNNTKVITSGNASYSEMFFAGAENAPLSNFPTYLESEVAMINASRNTLFYHTGKYSVATTSNSQFGISMKNGEHRPGKYKVSVWVEKTNAAKARINNNGSIIDFTETYTAGNWILKTGYVNVPVGAYSVYVTSADGSTVYFDDLMIRPVASSITGYVYNEWDELTHIIANNGLATRFEYDAAGRLIRTYSEIIDDPKNGITGGFKLVKSNTYNNKFF
ncbi:hypothetical protein LNQ49_04680 [Flavobacterium sp. F-65]|uniref:YD repeat-containing protein n=1 Tax=Flavobacterium pisciphilum TaxID=2893755 RepID=A0ABS8MRY0_9FLAO|nr:RHS repeat domain-containing protein [Flavobacterium sp. F-65]MCC9070892.1 hypothetical protein [Flavobacterium sp. F-65]